MNETHKETVLLVGGPYDGRELEVNIGWPMVTLVETYHRRAQDDGTFYWGRTPTVMGDTARMAKGDDE